jgi:hypothetical protein
MELSPAGTEEASVLADCDFPHSLWGWTLDLAQFSRIDPPCLSTSITDASAALRAADGQGR